MLFKMSEVGIDPIQKRAQKKAQFEEDFKNANNQTDIIQAYARYCGNLEALLDMYEVERSL